MGIWISRKIFIPDNQKLITENLTQIEDEPSGDMIETTHINNNTDNNSEHDDDLDNSTDDSASDSNSDDETASLPDSLDCRCDDCKAQYLLNKNDQINNWNETSLLNEWRDIDKFVDNVLTILIKKFDGVDLDNQSSDNVIDVDDYIHDHILNSQHAYTTFLEKLEIIPSFNNSLDITHMGEDITTETTESPYLSSIWVSDLNNSILIHNIDSTIDHSKVKQD